MKKETVDSLDKKLIDVLTENGRMPVGEIGQRLGITSPTVRSRMKSLIESGILKIGAAVDASNAAGITIALIGISLDTYQLDEKLDQISKLDMVNWAAVVTGRFDILIELVSMEGMLGLYRFLSEELHRVGGVRSSETFVVMKANRKWIHLPVGARKSW